MRTMLYTVHIFPYDSLSYRRTVSTVTHVRLTLTQHLNLSRRIQDLISANVLGWQSKIVAFQKPAEMPYDEFMEFWNDHYKSHEDRIEAELSGHQKEERAAELRIETRKRPRQRKKVDWARAPGTLHPRR